MQNPDHWLCLSLLATLHLNAARQDPAASTAKTDVVKGVELLKQAQKINKDAPSVLIQLADVLFQKGETQKSAAAAQKALDLTDNDGVKAMAHLLLGRIAHQKVRLVLRLSHLLLSGKLGYRLRALLTGGSSERVSRCCLLPHGSDSSGKRYDMRMSLCYPSSSG